MWIHLKNVGIFVSLEEQSIATEQTRHRLVSLLTFKMSVCSDELLFSMLPPNAVDDLREGRKVRGQVTMCSCSSCFFLFWISNSSCFFLFWISIFFFAYYCTLSPAFCSEYEMGNVLFSQSHITLHFSVFALFQFCYWIIDSVGFMRSGVWSCNHPFFGHNWLHGYVKAGTNTNGFVNVNSSFSFVFFIRTDHTHIFFHAHTKK